MSRPDQGVGCFARRRRARGALLIVALAGCTGGLERPADGPPDLDENAFRCSVEPVLVQRCAFLACHGSAPRPLRIYARNRLRLGVPGADRNRRLTSEEERANYDRARAFAVGGEDALLVAKPLDVRTGGLFHRGQEIFGGEDVFSTPEDPGYRRLLAWIEDTDHPADDCVPTEDVGP